jgi:hypothetical protein
MIISRDKHSIQPLLSEIAFLRNKFICKTTTNIITFYLLSLDVFCKTYLLNNHSFHPISSVLFRLLLLMVHTITHISSSSIHDMQAMEI